MIDRRLVAELAGTGLLLYVVVGSGIAAETLGSDGAAQLLAHAVVVGAGLGVLIALFAAVSGSHFNPAVSMAFWRSGALGGRDTAGYVGAQLVGAVLGVIAANAGFGRPMVMVATTARSGTGRIVSEAIATFVLVLVILVLVRTGRTSWIPAAVGAWVATIIFATVSTGFANPAVTIARTLTDTYTGIAPRSVVGFVAAQLLAGLAAGPAAAFLHPAPRSAGAVS